MLLLFWGLITLGLTVCEKQIKLLVFFLVFRKGFIRTLGGATSQLGGWGRWL